MAAGLLLLSDLSIHFSETSSLNLQFLTEGFELGHEKGAIGVLIDNGSLDLSFTADFKRSALSPGYHLLRAVLINTATNECIKTPAAYIEAEFYVGNPLPVLRPFMFGQPSLFIVSPRQSASKASTLKIDFYVSNCEISKQAYNIRLYVNKKPYKTVFDKWDPIILTTHEALNADSVDLKLVLLRPSGKEIQAPEYNHTTLTVQLKS